MQARRITVASLTLAGLCVSLCNPAHAQAVADPKPPTEAQQPYPAQPYPEPAQQPYQGQGQGQGQPDQQQPYQGQPYQGQPYQGQPYQQPYQGQPYQGQPYQGQPYQGQGQPYQPYQPQPYYPQPQPGYALPHSTAVRYVKRPRVGLIVGGAVMLGVGWSLSALGAAYAGSSSSCSSGYYDSYSYTYSGGCYDRVWPLFIPLLGPWIQMGYVNNDTGTMALLAFDGLVQAGGLAMMIIGAATRTRVAIYAKNNLQVNPLLLTGGSGLMVTGRF